MFMFCIKMAVAVYWLIILIVTFGSVLIKYSVPKVFLSGNIHTRSHHFKHEISTREVNAFRRLVSSVSRFRINQRPDVLRTFKRWRLEIRKRILHADLLKGLYVEIVSFPFNDFTVFYFEIESHLWVILSRYTHSLLDSSEMVHKMNSVSDQLADFGFFFFFAEHVAPLKKCNGVKLQRFQNKML